MVVEHGVRTDPDEVEAMLTLKTTTTDTQLNYYLQVFPKFCKFLSRIHKGIRKQNPPDAAADEQQRKKV